MDWGIFSKPITILEDHNVIIAKIVWNVKYTDSGIIARYKACLVTRSFI